MHASTIRQGNAVIAIKDASDAILWSWHIWVTDENIGQTIEVTNHQSYKCKFMPVNLGWCDGRTETYAERSCKVKFTAGDASKEVIIKQASNSIAMGSNHPYYQWGRKDPFLPANEMCIRDRFLSFSKKYKVMLLFICVFIFYTCSISNLFFILFIQSPLFELYLRYFILFSTLCHGEWKLLFGF